MPDTLEERYRDGSRDVQRFDFPPHGDPHEPVTFLGDPWTDATTLSSEHKGDRSGHIDGREIGSPGWIHAVNPHAGLFQLLD